MTHYRLYGVDGAGKIEAAEWIEASTDGDAIMIARGLRPSLNCELWEHGRLVARLPMEGPMAFFVSASAEAKSLTPLERNIVALVAQGRSAKEIARSTTLAPRTVERHLDECRQKLAAKNNAQLVAVAVSRGDILQLNLLI